MVTSRVIGVSSVVSNASITEFPVQTIESGGTPSASRFRTLLGVAAKCSADSRVVRSRFISSG